MAKPLKIPLKLKRKHLRKIKREKNVKRNWKNDDFTVDHETKQPPVLRRKIMQNVEYLQEADSIRFRKLTEKMRSQRILQLQEDNAKEERIIKSLEKKLKMTAKKKSLPKSFITEGLDYLLEVCDYEKFQDPVKLTTDARLSEMKSEPAKNMPVRTQGKAPRCATSYEEEYELNLHEEIENTPSKNNSRKSVRFPSDCKRKEISCITNSNDETVRHESGHTSGKKKRKNLSEEELYFMNDDEKDGILSDDVKTVSKSEDASSSLMNSSATYVSPALRRERKENVQTNEVQSQNLKRQLKGLLNRLTGKNIHSIVSQIETLYLTNSRYDVNNTMTELLKESLISNTFTSLRMIAEHALLISTLHANIGSEVGAYVLQKLTHEYQLLISERNLLIEDKRIDNIVGVLTQMYNFKIFHACLMYELLNQLLNRFHEKDIDLILLILKNVGFNLRKDDPLKFKEIIFNVQKKANTSPLHQESARSKFMLDTLLAIKNNNKLKIVHSDLEYVDSLKKLSKTLLNPGKCVNELKITLEDLLNAETKGRWWIVGSAWTGNALKASSEKQFTNNSCLTFDQKLLNLARKHRMNTDIRKNIFCIMMSAEDCVDAFEKLLKLGLKGNQQREIIHITVHCLLQEKKYNPYYSFVIEQFLSLNRKYQIAAKFCLWDKFKNIDSLTNQQVLNLAKFLAYLIQNKKFSLSILKVMQFTEMDKLTVKFIRHLLLSLLLTTDDVIRDIFGAISKSEKLSMLREGLQLFLHHFILKEIGRGLWNKSSEFSKMLPEKVKLAENAMLDSNY